MTGFNEKIIAIKSDHSYGSTILLQEIINVFITTKYSNNELLQSFSELGKIDSSMVVIHHFLKELKPAIGQDFQHKVAEYASTWKNVNERIAENLKANLSGDSLIILTHSHSGAIIGVVEILLRLGYTIEIIQTESQPGGEGKIQATALERSGLDVALIKDDSIIEIIDNVNCCFLGVDQFDEKSFVNKVGSKEIVEIAYQANIPVFVLGDSRKKAGCIQPGESRLFEIVPIKSNVRIITP